jgi:riboflavin kinase/FMN adenylyltransferase
LAESALPGDGIYATRAHLGSGSFESATYVGTRPTFGGSDRMVEVFLLDFDGDLYGERLRVEWVARVREDRTFASAEQLAEQMGRDVAAARVALRSP